MLMLPSSVSSVITLGTCTKRGTRVFEFAARGDSKSARTRRLAAMVGGCGEREVGRGRGTGSRGGGGGCMHWPSRLTGWRGGGREGESILNLLILFGKRSTFRINFLLTLLLWAPLRRKRIKVSCVWSTSVDIWCPSEWLRTEKES